MNLWTFFTTINFWFVFTVILIALFVWFILAAIKQSKEIQGGKK